MNTEEIQKRTYQLHVHGGSYCITIPKPLVSEAMLKHGVRIHLLGYDKNSILLMLVVVDERGRKYAKNSEKGRADTQKLRAANSIQ